MIVIFNFLGGGGMRKYNHIALIICIAFCAISKQLLETNISSPNYKNFIRFSAPLVNLHEFVIKWVCQWNKSRAGIVIRLGARRSRVGIPAWTRNSSVLQNVQTGPGSYPVFPLECTAGSFQMVNQPRREVDHRPPSIAEINNEWSYDSTPHMRLHGVDSYSFSFTNGVYYLHCLYCCTVHS